MMKTLVTLITCLFVVDAANAEDKWEYLQIKTLTPKGHPFPLSIFGDGKYKDQKVEFGLVYSDKEKKVSQINLKTSNEKLKPIFGDGFNEFHVNDFVHFFNFFGKYGYEFAFTQITNEFHGHMTERIYILKRKTKEETKNPKLPK